jgi:hypothetical protein
MKHLIWAIAVVVIGAGILLEFRYAIIVHTPVVVRFDRLSGDAWIVNSGVWRKVQALPPEQEQEVKAVIPEKAASKTK